MRNKFLDSAVRRTVAAELDASSVCREQRLERITVCTKVDHSSPAAKTQLPVFIFMLRP